MVKRKKKTTQGSHPVSFYKLSEVTQKINSGQFLIRSNATREALHDFGWEISDILSAYRMLKPNHFCKTDSSIAKPGLLIDVYKAHLFGEDVYTHFYIDDSIHKLIINSFHKLT